MVISPSLSSIHKCLSELSLGRMHQVIFRTKAVIPESVRGPREEPDGGLDWQPARGPKF